MNNLQGSTLEDAANMLQAFYTEYEPTLPGNTNTMLAYYLRGIRKMPTTLKDYQASVNAEILRLNERYVDNDFAWREKYVTLLEKYQKLLEQLHKQEQL